MSEQKLTAENAEKYLGKKLYSDRGLFHYYPLEVVRCKADGEIYYKDITGTLIPVPDEKDTFNNNVYFDRAE